MVVARYSQGLNTDEVLAMLRSSATNYYHADGLGSVTSLTNAAGALAQTYTFDSFGKQTSSSGSLTNPFQYTARELDTETGLYFYRARYYDPAVGRFVREDPLGFEANPDFYTYAGNSSTNSNDPFGLAECVYSVGQRTMVCTSNFVPRVGPRWEIQLGPKGVHSGDPGPCQDNPKCVDNWGSGPIKPDRYRMNKDLRPEHRGWNMYRLEPWPHKWWHGPGVMAHLRRGGFELHVGSITHGCINADKFDPQTVDQFNRLIKLLDAEDGSNYLTVTP